MKKVIDMVGRRFGRLTVIEEAGRKRKEVTWKCKCDCGAETVVTGYYLRSGHTQSCGCLIKDSKTIKHGLYGSRIHSIYYNMKNRCYNPNYYLFHRYGGRGIAVCDEWLGENGLQNFYEWSVENGYSGTDWRYHTCICLTRPKPMPYTGSPISMIRITGHR